MKIPNCPLKLVFTFSLVALIACVGVGVVQAIRDYKTDPENCAILFYPKSSRDSWLLPRLGYNVYLAFFTDVEYRRERSRQRLLDGTVRKQVMDEWNKRNDQGKQFKEEMEKGLEKAGVEAMSKLQNRQPHGFPIIDAAKCPPLDGFGGMKFGGELPTGAQPISLSWADHPADGKTYIVAGFGIDSAGQICQSNQFTVVDISPKTKKIYRIAKYIKRPEATAKEYLERMREKWDVPQAGGALCFSNARITVEDRFFSFRGIRISAVDIALKHQSQFEVKELQNAAIDKDLGDLK